MNDKHLDALLSMANLGAPLSMNDDVVDRVALAQANIDLAAMLQPITAEALVADGWKKITGDYFSHPVLYLYVEFEVDGSVEVWIDKQILRTIRTMYDLRELVRLLGGQA